MSNRLRVLCLAVTAVVAVPVLSACSTSPGAAALIGSTRITTGQLQSQVDESLASGVVQKQTGYNRASFTRELLSHMISVDILNAIAANRHVTVSSKDISTEQAEFVQQAGSLAALQQQAAAGGVSKGQLPGFIRYAALEQNVGNSLIANLPASTSQLAAEYKKDIDQFDQLNVAQIAVSSKTLAQQILTKVRRTPSSFAALAAKDSVDTATKDKGGVVGFVGRSQVQKVLGAGVPVKPGTFELAHSGSQYVVLHIISRRTQPISAVTQQLRESLFSSQATTLLQKAVSTESTKLGIHVSPRYGRWDSKTQAVVATTSQVSSSSSPTASPTSTG